MEKMNKITLVLADDELLFRQGLRAILSKHEDFEILFDSSDGADVVSQLREANTLPDIVIIDLKMPELNGVEATKIIIEEFPEVKIIALTSYFSKPFILNMFSIGAVAYLAKNSTPSLMVKTIQEVASKGFYYDDQVFKYIQEGLLGGFNNRPMSKFDKSFISKRELEVLELICRQYTTVEIGDSLFISPRTVEGHRNSLFLKTDSKNSAGLVVFALQNDIVKLDIPF